MKLIDGNASLFSAERLALGTVQFGVDYGVTNAGGKTPASEVARVLELACEYGIDTLDTAPAYGSSEQVLGDFLRGLQGSGSQVPTEDQGKIFRIVTKTPVFEPGEVSLGAQVRASALRSCERLGVDTLDALLTHRAADVIDPDKREIWSEMERLKAEGRVCKIGVSCYSPEELRSVLDVAWPDVVQVPFSIIDRRFAPLLEVLAGHGIEVHTRSCFLQGILLVAPATLPVYFAPYVPFLQEIQNRIRQAGLTPLEACLNFALAQGATHKIDRVVVGVNDAAQVREIKNSLRELDPSLFNGLESADTSLVEPFRWKL